VEKLTSFSGWRQDPDVLELLAKVHFEKGDVAAGTEALFLLIEACLDRNEKQRASEAFEEVRELLAADPVRSRRLEERLASAAPAEKPAAPRVVPPAPMPAPSPAKEYSDEEEEEEGAAVIGSPQPREEPLLLSPEPPSPENTPAPAAAPVDKAFADMTQDLLSELQELREPPQKKLDELEFFISIEDYHSATILLQELIASYPDSTLLAGFKNLIPMEKEENIAETLDEVKASLSKTMQGEKSPEEFYNMGIVHLSMGMLAEAITYFEQTIRLDPDNMKYLVALADAWYQSGKTAQSLKYYRHAAERATDPDTKREILEKVANIYYTAGDAENERRTREEIRLLKR